MVCMAPALTATSGGWHSRKGEHVPEGVFGNNSRVAGGGGWVSLSSGVLVQCTSLRRSMHVKGHSTCRDVQVHWYLDTYMPECIPEGSVGMLGAFTVCTCLCVGECRHMCVVWGTCEPVCPPSTPYYCARWRARVVAHTCSLQLFLPLYTDHRSVTSQRIAPCLEVVLDASHNGYM